MVCARHPARRATLRFCPTYRLGKIIAWGLDGHGLFDGTGDIPAFCPMLFERGFAVLECAPLGLPGDEVPDDFGQVVSRIRPLTAPGSRSVS